MRVHHLNCGTRCPAMAFVDRSSRVFEGGGLVCHCLLVEGKNGLVLIDTGFGTEDVARPRERLGFLLKSTTRLNLAATAIEQIKSLGFSPADVRDIVVTHLDFDHAGGISDFPDATIHVFEAEHAAAVARKSFSERERYRPLQWSGDVKWKKHQVAGDRWFGFESVRVVTDQVLLVPMIGHTRGHCAVAVDTGDGWLLHCGDAYFFRGEVDPVAPHCPPMLSQFQRLIATDDRARRLNQGRLLGLVRAHEKDVRLFSAHDGVEFDAFAKSTRNKMANVSPLADLV